MITGNDLGDVLDHLKQDPDDALAFREGWNGKGMYIQLQVPDTNSKMSLPYIYMFTADKKLVPWLASQTDLLAEDWVLSSHFEREETSNESSL